MKNKKKKMRLSKFTKLTLSALMVLTCVHFSSVKAEDSSVEGSSSPETVEIVETPAPTTTPEIVETTPEPTPEVVESTPEPTPEVVEATPAPTVETVVQETLAPAAETPAPVEASKEPTEAKVNTVTEGYKLVEVITTEEETHEEETDDEENTEDGEPTPILFSVMLAEAADTQYTVELRNESNDVLENINLSSGNVKDEFSKVYATGYEKEGKKYSFKEARITQSEGLDYLPISYVAVYEDGIYYSTNSVTGTKLADGEKIVIILKEVVETFAVNYEVWVDDVLSTDYSNIVTLEGTESEVDINKTVNFVVSPKKGYTISNVTQNGVSLAVNGNQYTTNPITETTTIRIDLNEKTTSTISFKGSNTKFTFNNKDIYSGDGETKHNFSTDKTNKLTFTLKGYQQHSDKSKDLNKVSISLKYNGETEIDSISLNLPTAKGQSLDTIINDELTATVQKSDKDEGMSWSGSIYRSWVYTVTITSTGKIYDDIEVTTNFKDTDRSELFVTSTTGVSVIEAYGDGYNNGQKLDPKAADGNLLNIKKNTTYTFYFNVLPGYIPDASKIVVTGTKDSSTLQKIIVKKSDDINKGAFMFSITTDKSKDYRLSVTAMEAKYQIIYNADGIDASRKYKHTETAVLTTNRPTNDNSHVFEGWLIDGDTSGTVYKLNQTVKISELEQYATWNSTKQLYEIRLTPKWLNVGEAKTLHYVIIIKSDDNSLNTTFEGTTAKDKKIKVFQTELEKQLGINSDDYYLSPEEQRKLTETVVTKEGQPIELNYIYRQTISVDDLEDIVYNGFEQKLSPIVKSSNRALTENEDYILEYSSDVTNVGTVTITVKGINKYKGEVQVSYSIKPKAVTVTAENKTKQFGATDPEFTAKAEGTLGEDKVTYTISREPGEDAGTYAITVSGEESQGNYTVRYVAGTLTITKAESTALGLKVSNTDASKEYDGTPLTVETTVDVKEGTKISYSTDKGNTWKEAAPSITDVGTLKVTVKAENSNYGIARADYTLTVTPKAVTVTAENKTKQFGATDPEFTAKAEGTLGEDKVTYTISREPGEDAGTYAITVSGEESQGNYTVRYVAGTLTITKAESTALGLKVSNTDASKEYDGTPLTVETTVDVKEGTKISYSTDKGNTWKEAAPSITDVGTLKVTVKAENSNYGIARADYTLTVTPKAVTVTAENKTKQFGATDPEFTAKAEGTLGEDKVTYTISREPGEDAGTYAITVSGEESQGNYTVRYVAGTLTITPKTIESEDSGLVVEKTADVTYIGKPQYQKPIVKDGEVVLYETTDYSLEYDGDTTNVGTVTVKVIGKGNYEGTLKTTYSIIARNVTLTSGSASKEYDGKPLTKAGVVISEDGFVEDEVADVLAVGSITNVGSVDNTIKIVATDKFNENNYVIKYELGKLTVTEKNNPKPEPTEEPKGCPVDTVWNEEKGICEKAVIVPVVPGGGNKPKVTPEPTIAPSETPEASATPSIEPTSTPKPTSSAETAIVEDNVTPTTARKEHLALINLLATISSILFGLLLLISKNEKENEDGTQKRSKVWKIVAVIDALLSIVVFVLTENMKQPMVLVDKWTMLMILFTLISIVSFAFGRKYHEEDEKAENA